MQYEVLSLMLQDRNMMLPNVRFLKKHVFYCLETKFYCYWFLDETYVSLKLTTLQNIS